MNNNFQKSVHPTFLMLISFVMLSFNSAEEKVVTDFKLLNVDGKMVSLNNFPDVKGFIIVFTCNHCPFAKLYPERMNKLNDEYKPLGVPLIAISSTDTIMYEEDTYSNMIEKATTEYFNYPYLFDEYQSVAKNYGAQKTPHAFVIWKVNNQWVVKYNGAIDDNGAEPDKVTEHYVENAVNQLLKNKTVKVSATSSIGCQIKFRN